VLPMYQGCAHLRFILRLNYLSKHRFHRKREGERFILYLLDISEETQLWLLVDVGNLAEPH
jgi:hypothetical protein